MKRFLFSLPSSLCLGHHQEGKSTSLKAILPDFNVIHQVLVQHLWASKFRVARRYTLLSWKGRKRNTHRIVTMTVCTRTLCVADMKGEGTSGSKNSSEEAFELHFG